MERDMETDEEEDMDMEDEEEIMVFEVNEIDLEYEFDAARWYDFTREELDVESTVAEFWFQTAQSYPPSPFAIKLLMREDSSKSEDGEVEVDVKDSDREVREQPDVNETGVFTFIQGGSLEKVPNESLHKGPTFSNRLHTDKLKCQPKSSTKPRSSTLMKPTASQLAKQEHIRLQMQVNQVKDKSEIQATKRQKLDGGLLRKVNETPQEMNFVHKALKKDHDRNLQNARIKITVPQEPDFATSHRANRIRQKKDAKPDQDSTSVYRFKARPFNRKIFEAPSLPIRKKSTPKLPEFHEFHLKTSERALQHSSAVSKTKGSDKSDMTAILDGVNREPRRPRAMDIPKDDDDRKHIFKSRPLSNKIISCRQDTGIFRKSKRDPSVRLTQAQEFSFHSEKKSQPDLPTDLFSKLSLTSELQPNNGPRLRFPQPEQVKGSKENRLNTFQSGVERTSKVTEKPVLQQRGIWTTRR